jgi:hypothetical protein
MNMTKFVVAILVVSFLYSCKQKEEEPEEPAKKFISVVAMIKAQVAHVDTSLNPIIKIVSRDSTQQDTISLSREDFAKEAKDFLEIPDLADKKVAKRYKEDPPLYDDMLGRVIFKYTPIDPDKEEIKSQEFLATPVPGKEAKINNIMIVREISNRDSFLQKKMLWQMDKSFQVVTTSQKPGQSEVTTVTRVVWNEDPYQ